MPAKVLVGKVVAFYDAVSRAAISLQADIEIGDLLLLEKGTDSFKQRISELQVENINVQKGFKGDSITIKVDKPVQEGYEVYKLI